MIEAKTITLALAGIIGASGISLTGIYTAAFSDIQSILKDDLLDQNENTEEWKALQKTLNTKSEISENQDLGLVSIKDTDQNPSDGNKIKEWCQSKYKVQINRLFPTTFQAELLNYVKEFCVLTIKDKITESQRLTFNDNTNDETLKSKFNSLKSSSNDQDLVEELIEIKKEEEQQGWPKLKEWCAMTYSKGYKNAQNKIWKNADSYCKK